MVGVGGGACSSAGTSVEWTGYTSRGNDRPTPHVMHSAIRDYLPFNFSSLPGIHHPSPTGQSSRSRCDCATINPLNLIPHTPGPMVQHRCPALKRSLGRLTITASFTSTSTRRPGRESSAAKQPDQGVVYQAQTQAWGRLWISAGRKSTAIIPSAAIVRHGQPLR